MGHYCFNCKDYTDNGRCKELKHDLDYEDLFRPPVKVMNRQKNGDDLSHAELISEIADKMFKSTHLVYLERNKEFFYWNYRKLVWEPQGNSFLMKLFNEVTPRVMKSKQKVYNDAIFQLKLDTVTLPRNFEPNRNYLYFKNAALNLDKLQIDGKHKDHNIQVCLDTELDPYCKDLPRVFLTALKKALPNPLDLFDCLQALSSVLLVRNQRIEKAFFLLGSGGNGKSTIMKVLDNIFQSYISHVDMLDLQKDGFSKTALVDKLANSFSEISKMKQKDVGVFKAIASGDTQSINSKFKDRFDSVIKVIQFYSSNQMPEIEEVNEGFIRRAHPIEFNEKITNIDRNIDDKLNTPEEKKKILTLLIRVARFTKQHGFIYEKTSKEKENILLKKTNPINEFLSAGVVVKREGLTIPKKDLYSLYEKYCQAQKFRPQNTLVFSRFLTMQGFSYAGRNENPHWIGLGIPQKDQGQNKL